MSDLGLDVSFFSPLFLGLVLHGFCITFGWLARLAVPIDRGAQFRGCRWFGANKTWRGLVAVASGSAVGYTLVAHHAISALGALLGMRSSAR